MEPIFGFLLFGASVLIVTAIAAKKGLQWFFYFLMAAVGGPALVVLVARMGGSGFQAGSAAFLAPLVTFVTIMFARNDQEVAVDVGAYGDYKKCPYCAEAVRKEAIRCKHCQADLSSSPAESH